MRHTLHALAMSVVFSSAGVAVTSETLYTSTPTDLDIVSYPESYRELSPRQIDAKEDPCKLDYSEISYQEAWLGQYPLPLVTGAPFSQNYFGGMGLKDIMLPDNPTFNLEANCKGNLNAEFDRTIERLVKLNVHYVKIPQWHWINVNADGSWFIVEAEKSFGPLPDANLSYFVKAAHAAGLKVIMMNQIQGIRNEADGSASVPEPNKENYKKWFAAFSEFLKERSPYFQSIGIDVWELGCGYCIFNNVGTGSSSDEKYFAAETENLIPIMRESYEGSLLVMASGRLVKNKAILSASEFINFSIDDIGFGRITSSNSAKLDVELAKKLILQDQLETQYIKSFDNLGKTLVFDVALQSRSNIFSMPGYLEETGCTSSIGDLNISETTCLQREIQPDFSVQAIFFEAAFEGLASLDLKSTIIPLPTDYWETDSMVSQTVFPNLGSTIRNKPAEGIVKIWYGSE